jgi:hypothetical protein
MAVTLTLATASVSFHLHQRRFSHASAKNPPEIGRYIPRAAEKRVKTL